MKVKINEVRKVLEQKWVDVGYTKAEAKIIADEYLLGEILGRHSHGVFSALRGAYQAKKKKRGHFKVIKNKGNYLYIEGNNDKGQIVATYAVKEGIKKAKKHGNAIVGMKDIQAFLRPGRWAGKIADNNMIGLCFNYGGAPLMAPYGAKEAVLSTNPIGIGIPTGKTPFVIDMATSVRAYYEVRMAKEMGRKLKPGLAIDKNGKMTTDPNKVEAVLPFGGYKGSALAMALEIMTGPLLGTFVGKRSKKGKRGALFIIIDPKMFGSLASFKKDVQRLLKDVKTARKQKGVKEILYPGERAYRFKENNLKNGYLEIDEEIWEKIINL
ncbi:Ldh family oxidoreductase [Patescibacteria group bacterium]|nr:Ldh family oxidoreductase [Patescibacteria group bacterium]